MINFEEEKFEDICVYLSNKGIPFNVVVDDIHGVTIETNVTLYFEEGKCYGIG